MLDDDLLLTGLRRDARTEFVERAVTKPRRTLSDITGTNCNHPDLKSVGPFLKTSLTRTVCSGPHCCQIHPSQVAEREQHERPEKQHTASQEHHTRCSSFRHFHRVGNYNRRLYTDGHLGRGNKVFLCTGTFRDLKLVIAECERSTGY